MGDFDRAYTRGVYRGIRLTGLLEVPGMNEKKYVFDYFTGKCTCGHVADKAAHYVCCPKCGAEAPEQERRDTRELLEKHPRFDEMEDAVREASKHSIFADSIDKERLEKDVKAALKKIPGLTIHPPAEVLVVVTGMKYRGSLYNDVPVLASEEIPDNHIYIGRILGFGDVKCSEDETVKGKVNADFSLKFEAIGLLQISEEDDD